jgi:hypothetical protein
MLNISQFWYKYVVGIAEAFKLVMSEINWNVHSVLLVDNESKAKTEVLLI